MRPHGATHALRILGGIASTGQLLEGGVAEDALTRAVAGGEIVRPRRGILALPGSPRRILQAVAHGGALACVSAAAHHGFWTPPDRRLHVSVRPNYSATPNSGVHYHRDSHRLAASERFLVSPTHCVAQCVRHLPFDDAVALVDSALHQAGRESWSAPGVDLEQLRQQLPRRLHPVLDAVDARAESGAESLARIRLLRAGVVVRPQRWITSGIRVDLLVGDRLVVEIGSETFHAYPEQYEKDHRRATTLLALGLDVLEFTTRQVMEDWETVESVIVGRSRAGLSE